jgi:hypothetical protein
MIFRPAWRILPVRKVSALARLPRIIKEPISCKRPFIVGPRSFMKNGTPAKGPAGFIPSFSGSATTSSNTSTTAWTSGLISATPAAACAANSAGDTSPIITRSAKPTASCLTHSCQFIAKVIATLLA